MNIFRKIERWFRVRVLNQARQTVAQEIAASLDQISGAIDRAIVQYAESVGGQPLAVFVAVALGNIGLSAAAVRLLQDLVGRTLGAGTSRGVRGARDREAAAREDIRPLIAAIREEARKA